MASPSPLPGSTNPPPPPALRAPDLDAPVNTSPTSAPCPSATPARLLRLRLLSQLWRQPHQLRVGRTVLTRRPRPLHIRLIRKMNHPIYRPTTCVPPRRQSPLPVPRARHAMTCMIICLLEVMSRKMCGRLPLG